MTLPNIDTPTHMVKIPSTGQEITIRPFLVKEEKLLLMAAESKDETEIIKTTKQIINNCIISPDNIDIDILPFFDIDYLFIALRAKSVGETIDVDYTCNNVLEEDVICGNKFTVKIDISNCEIVKNPDISMDIILSNKIRLKMKYPNYSILKILNSTNYDIDLSRKIDVICECITTVVDGEKVYTKKDFTPRELTEFVEKLTQDQFKKLENFVDNFPSFVVVSDTKCSKCGYNHHIIYDDFSSFFL